MAAWAGVAHSSGSGWVQAVGALLAAVLLTGLILPAVPARRATVTCMASPSDTEVGCPAVLTMVTNRPLRVRPRLPVGPVTKAGGAVRGARRVEVPVTPDRRGVLDHIVVEIASCAPFGILWWAKEVVVGLPRPLHVAPRSGAEPDPPGRSPDDLVGGTPIRTVSTSGELRGVRPYQPGDSRRSVHWPATSHTGTLMVRETEQQIDDPLVVEVVLPPDPVQAERASERALATIARELSAGRTVLLITTERDGRVVRPIRDRIDLGRRLARAVSVPAATGLPSGRSGTEP
jgi:uncharacterized protein (DUF58 family)